MGVIEDRALELGLPALVSHNGKITEARCKTPGLFIGVAE